MRVLAELVESKLKIVFIGNHKEYEKILQYYNKQGGKQMKSAKHKGSQQSKQKNSGKSSKREKDDDEDNDNMKVDFST